MKNATKQMMIIAFVLSSSIMFGQVTHHDQTREQKEKFARMQALSQNRENSTTTSSSQENASGPGDNMLEIGNTNAGYGSWPTYYVPWGNYWRNQRSQTLYLASEFGQPMMITELAWNFEQLSGPDNYFMNLSVKILEVTGDSLTTGAFYDMSGATEVFSADNFVPATSTGWNTIDINDYIYTQTNNLIIEISNGDNGYFEYPYYRTYKTEGNVSRMLVGYSDVTTPAPYSASSNQYDNLRVYYQPLAGSGSVEGYTFNGDGLIVAGTNVGIPELNEQTISGSNGYYLLDQVLGGNWELMGWKQSYNAVTYPITIVGGTTIQQDIVLTQPGMIINPLQLDETLNPNEYLTTFLGILNTGDGPLHWEAEITYNDNYQTLDPSNEPPIRGFADNSGNSPLFQKDVDPVQIPENSRDLFACNEGSLFANEPAGATNAYWSQHGGSYQAYQQVTGLSDSWNTISWWGVYTSGTPTTEDFFIGIYENGSQAGAEIASYLVECTPIATGELLLGSYPIWQYIATIATRNETDFFISCQNTTSPQMYWVNSPGGTGISGTGPSWSPVDPLAVCIEDNDLGGWLSLDQYEGDVNPNGGSFNLPVHFDATGFESGDYETADITFTSTPDVGTIVIPCSMTVVGSPFSPPVNCEACLIDDVTGCVDILWEWYGDAIFEYFRIERDGVYIGSTTELSFTDDLPDFGEYTYQIFAVYDEGTSAGCNEYILWPNPGLSINPDSLTAVVWTNHQAAVLTTIENTGLGTLTYLFPDYDHVDAFSCGHSIEMTDDFGDGWNGGELDVFVDGVLVLNNITLSGGSGLEYEYFTAESGQTITTTFTCGNWCYECEYRIYDGEGNEIIHDGANGTDPTGKTGTAFCPQPGFIIDVTPPSGFLYEGEEQQIAITYDAAGFDPGTYEEWLYLESNDPDHLTDSIHNTMIVTQPAAYSGTVTNCNTGAPIAGVEVSAGPFNSLTNDIGQYYFNVDPGTYDVLFEKAGFQSVVVNDTTATAGVTSTIDIGMCEFPYLPGWVTATVNYPDDTECLVEWTVPWGAYEISYDDGTADDFLVFSVPGNAHAVKFTPSGYPAKVLGGKVFVGDGSFPAGSNFLGSKFGMAVMDDNGPYNKPGTILDSMEVAVDQYGWLDFTGFDVELEEGDFYLAMFQGNVPPNAAPIGIDQTVPTAYRSYTYIGGLTDFWSLSAYQDFMIRAVVHSPQTGSDVVLSPEYKQPPKASLYKKFIATGKPSGIPGYVKSGKVIPAPEYSIEGFRETTGYQVSRFSNFDPNGSPLSGDETILVDNTSSLSYLDYTYGGLPEGWYAYCVKARYSQMGQDVYSDCGVSSIVGHLKYVAITFNITTTDGTLADSTEIILTGLDYPYDVYTEFTDDSISLLGPVWKGCYDIFIYKPGYEPVLLENECIYADKTYDIILGEKKYPPTNLYVDPLTSIATWNASRITALKEDFEEEQFPPQGWSASTQKLVGWFRTDDGSGGAWGWTIPEWDSYYACTNDDMYGSTGHGCCDYLITHPIDLRESPGFSIKFDQYYDGSYGQLAFIEISEDAGESWELVQQMDATSNVWTYEEVDLSAYSNDYNKPMQWIAFHADDGGNWSSGWAIDNVEVSAGSDGDFPPSGYHVFLDDVFIAEVQEETYTYLNLVYGTEYTASVGAIYTSGLSEKDYYTFTSEWLYPPENLAAAAYDDAVRLIWEPPCAPWFEVLSAGPRTDMPNPNTEYSPIYQEVVNNNAGSRDMWDTQFEFPCGDASGEAGIESDGNYIYTTKWNAGNGTFFRYELDGAFLGSFLISGCQDVRDLAYDGMYFYGSNAGTTVWELDFDDEVVVGSIPAPVATRAIAYDDDLDAFWANNWSTNITLFDRDGVILNSFPVGTYGNYYGFAWHKFPFYDFPHLYGFSQDGSGAVIVQINLNTGQETGDTYDAIGFSTSGSGLAGGLFVEVDFVPAFYTLGGIIQNETIFGLELGICVTGNDCEVPENVLGFNVYRDEEFREYVGYEGQDQMEWWDYGLWPQCYDYTVTAVYDLSPYGQFGEEGESMADGPATVCISCCNMLPFMEDWESGTFTDKNWTVQCDNWDINTILGNPGNCAEFRWDPIIENYDCGILTFPLLGSDVYDGDIYLDFDLKIDDRFDTVDTEKLMVRVWADGVWTDMEEFTAEGDMDWEPQRIDITEVAKGYDFTLGFFAVGENSINIDGWYIDNIVVYQLCAEPADLTSEKIFDNGSTWIIELNWLSPQPSNAYWMSYNDGTFENAFASTDGGAGLAQMFTPGEYPVTITEVRYFNSSYEEYMQECEIWILKGDGETVLSGPYYVDEGPADDWVTIDIDDVTLNSGYFMVATLNVDAGGPYIGVDNSYYDGSLYFGTIGDFTEMGEFGYFYAGSHEAYVELEIGDNVVVNSVLTAPKASSNNRISDISLSGTSATAQAPASRALTGYNIWRNDELIEANWPDVTYYDTTYEVNEYCYYISAVYESCESDTLGYVCETFYPAVGETDMGQLDIYPNPANEKINIISSLSIERITIINYAGQLVYDATVVDATKMDIDVSTYDSGVYFIKVVTSEGIITERVTLTR
ncbi:MAG: carboxypeptidase regulatory-like domain-containing protein [Bacteroidota bacterium]|nr:carboxypeptidase regulatory-like domain-containing protein [Bacteroidota bacterium]